MSKAKHLHAILRASSQLPTASAAATSSISTTTAASLRLLPSRLVVGQSIDPGSRSIHTQATSHSLDHNQRSCQHQRQHHPASSRTRQRGHPCSVPACLLHTSARNNSLLPSSSVSAAAAAITPSAPSSSSNASADSIHYPTSATSSGNQAGRHAFSEQATPSQWTSELPWIDPLTQSSYDPARMPNTTGTNNNSNSNSNQGLTPASFFDQPFQNTRHNYVFAHGASGFAKNPNKGPTLTPEEDRAYFSVQVGEDSYFRRHDALGVADGVGGWSGTTGK
ncbi:hypothetical protein BGX24_005886 [Mortierella sp. AD032]|nr:hypothetical protein BGX24_005886 [Mortierella sp. AD032]